MTRARELVGFAHGTATSSTSLSASSKRSAEDSSGAECSDRLKIAGFSQSNVK